MKIVENDIFDNLHNLHNIGYFKIKELVEEVSKSVKDKMTICDNGLTNYYNNTDNPLSTACQSCKTGGWLCVFITQKCTNNCVYCPNCRCDDCKKLSETPAESFLYHSSTSFPSAFNTIVGFESLLNHYKGTIKSVSFSGGEPFQVLDKVHKFLDICNKVNPNTYNWINTNGLFANEDNMKRLSDNNLTEIRFDWTATRNHKKILKRMEEASKMFPKVAIEMPMYDIEAIRYDVLPYLEDIYNCGVSQLNCAELLINESNIERLNLPESYMYNDSPWMMCIDGGETAYCTWSRLLTYWIILTVDHNNIPLLINDCSHESKYWQSLQRALKYS